jgi:hypothetical protein
MDFDSTSIVGLISTVGFPIVMCGWFALRVEKSMVTMTTALNNMVTVVSVLTTKIGSDKNE